LAIAAGSILSGCVASAEMPDNIATTPAVDSWKQPNGTEISDDPDVRANVSIDVCSKSQDVGWKASGTISNPTDAEATYAIVISFTNEKSSVLDRQRTDVKVAAKGKAIWAVGSDVSGEKVNCVLRGASKL
jgi:hypothetical protein